MPHDSHQGRPADFVPRQPIHKITEPLARFLHVQTASGVVLLGASVAALIAANSPISEDYLAFWKTKVGFSFGDFEFRHSLKHIINDALMTVFFFVVGLEVKREIVLGELRDRRQAVLPVAAALGGMLVPAGIYLALQFGSEGARGWGIPMATDIAFVVGCMSLLGSRVPHGLRVMLLSLAIADDIGAILVIAIGYTSDLNTVWLAVGLIAILAVSGMARVGVRSIGVYTAAGVVIWYAFHESGVHATLAGVILGLMTPARSYISAGVLGSFLDQIRDVIQGGQFEALEHRAAGIRQFRNIARETISPLEYLETSLHPWVSFVIMPLFALANTGVVFQLSDLTAPISIAVALALVLGKPIGVMLFALAAVKSGVSRLPAGTTWPMILGGGCLAGIGFTMSLFIADLALEGKLLEIAKIGILSGSVVSALLGVALLRISGEETDDHDSAHNHPADGT